jgi:hypothetical protein
MVSGSLSRKDTKAGEVFKYPQLFKIYLARLLKNATPSLWVGKF